MRYSANLSNLLQVMKGGANNSNNYLSSSAKKKYFLLLVPCFLMFVNAGFGQSPTNGGFENGTTNWTTAGATGSTNARTGSNALAHTTASTSNVAHTNSTIISIPNNNYAHVIGWAIGSAANARASCGGTLNVTANSAPTTTIGTTLTPLTYSVQNISGSAQNFSCRVNTRSVSGSLTVYWDDVIMYTSTASTPDLTKPVTATGFTNGSITTSLVEFSWTNGSDAATGIQNTIILRTTNTSAGTPVMNDQGVYSTAGGTSGPNTVSTDWTVLSTSVASGSTTYSDATVSASTGYKYAVIHRDLAYNYSAALVSSTITTPASAGQIIDVQSPVGTSISSGNSRASFGSFQWGTDNDFTFRVRNTDGGSADLTINSVSFGGTHSGDFSLVSAPSFPLVIGAGTNYDFTVRFTPNGVGTRTGTITFNHDDVQAPGYPDYVINLSGTGTPNSASTITLDGAFTYNSDIDYKQFQASPITNTTTSIDVMRFIVSDGADDDNLPTILSSITFSSVGSIAIIRNAALFDGNTQLANSPAINTGAGTIAFSGLSISTNDNVTRTLSLRVSFYNTSANITDNSQMSFTVTNANVSAAGSNTSSLFTGFGSFTSSTLNQRNQIEVTATKIIFSTEPSSTAQTFNNLSTPPVISAVDVNNVKDLDYTGSIGVTNSGGLGMTGATSTFASGDATFSSLQFTQTGGPVTLTTNSGTLTNATTSVSITVISAPTVIVRWDFPNTSAEAVADAGIQLNASKTIAGQGGVTSVVYTNTGASGSPDKCVTAQSWSSGSGTKYWEVQFSTVNYQTLKFSSKQISSNTGPRDFKVQYKIGASGTYTDVTGGTVTVDNDNFIAGVLTDVSLPSGCENQPAIYLRWIMTSDFPVNYPTSTSVAGAGTSRIDDVLVTGVPLNSVAEYYQTVTDGNWYTVSVWQTSPDGINNWVAATVSPTYEENTITIRNGDIVTVDLDVYLDEVVIESGGIVSHSAGTVTLSNGTGADLTIKSGGTWRHAGNIGLPTVIGSANSISVESGGIVEVTNGTNGLSAAWGSNEDPTFAGKIKWNDGAIFYWNNSNSFSINNFTFFPNASSTEIPVFRFNGGAGNLGGNSASVVNGILEVNATMNWAFTGTKTFRNGLRGTGTINQTATGPCGQFIISGTAEISGSGTIALNSNGLSIASTSTTTLNLNKTINTGPISVAGTFDLTDKAISGTYSAFNLTATAVVRTSHVNGLRSATGALQNGSATYNLSFTSSTVEYYRTGAQAVTNNSYYNLSFRGNGDKSMQGNTSVFGNITWLDVSGVPVLKCGSHQLDVFGDWSSDSGSDFDRGTGTVNFGETGNTRTITGTNSFNILKIFGTVNISGGTQFIYDRIEVPTGAILNTNGNLTLQSGGSLLHGTGTTLGGGTVNGNMTVRRTGNSGGYTFNYWCSPVTNTNVSVLGSSLYYYEPTNATNNTTVAGLRAGWVPASGNMTQGLGYISSNGNTVSFTGTAGNAPTGTPITINVKKNVGTSNNVPWNLVGNPFPSSLDADAFINVNGPVAAGGSGAIAGSIYFWDDDNTGGTGWATNDYAVWNKAGTIPCALCPSSSGNAPIGHIASGQSFFVDKTADGTSSIEFRNTMRSSTNNVFFRQAPIERFWVNITNPNNEINETLIAFIDDATDSVDLLYDAKKLKGNAFISVYTKINGDNFAIQALPGLTNDRVIALGMDAGTAGAHTLRLSYNENLDETVILTLEDRLLNYFQNLNENPEYIFHTDAGIDISRFYIHINPPVQINVTNESCSGLDAEISIFQPGSKTWDYILYDDLGQLITSGTGFNGNLSFPSLKGGDYHLELADTSGFSISKNIAVIGKIGVAAGFSPDYSVVSTDQPVHFTNNSTGATYFDWNFGDGTIITGVAEPDHTYMEEGNYTVTLNAYNNDCSDEITQDISVYKIATGSQAPDEDKIFVSTIGEHILIHFDYRTEKQVELIIHNTLGQKVYESAAVSAGDFRIDLPGRNEQCFFLTVKDNSKALSAKIILFGN